MLFVGIDIGGTFTDLALYDSDSDGARPQGALDARRPGPRARHGRRRALRACRGGHGRPRRRAARHDGRHERGARASRRSTGMVTTAGRARRACTSAATSGREPYSVMLDIPWQSAPFVQRQHRLDGARAHRAAGGRGRRARSTRRPCARPRRELARGGRRGDRRLLPVLLPGPGARASALPRSCARSCRIASSPPRPTSRPQFREFERFTTASHERVRRPRHRRATSSTWSAALRREGVAARPARDAQQRRRRERRPRRAARPVTLMLSGPAAGVLGAQLGRRPRRAAGG